LNEEFFKNKNSIKGTIPFPFGKSIAFNRGSNQFGGGGH
jgi:hypothetical protein